MENKALDQLRQAFRAHGVEAPPEYVWLVQHRTLGFDDFSQFEPWQFCGIEEIFPLSKRWPKAELKRELIPFARMQGSDDLACFEFSGNRVIGVWHIHYDLGPPVYVEFHKEYPTIWDWLDSALGDVRFWFEQAQQKKEKNMAKPRSG
jgi:hypothetical protein